MGVSIRNCYKTNPTNLVLGSRKITKEQSRNKTPTRTTINEKVTQQLVLRRSQTRLPLI